MHNLKVLNSIISSTCTGWRGTNAHSSKQPEQLLELYDLEGCPYCMRVRIALTELDLDAIIYPCPKGGKVFRNAAENVGGKKRFPLLVDKNTNVTLYESNDIVAHLYQYYGKQKSRASSSTTLATLAVGTRPLKGLRATASIQPEQLLELYSFESSPYSRLVRERLSELEIPYILRNMGKAVIADMGPPWIRRTFFPNTEIAGRNRKKMMALTGRMQVPYLIDPNTGISMYESADILRYLDKNYARQ